MVPQASDFYSHGNLSNNPAAPQGSNKMSVILPSLIDSRNLQIALCSSIGDWRMVAATLELRLNLLQGVRFIYG